MAEKTEVLYGHENILKFMLPRYPSIKENIDACYDYSGPPDVVKVEPVWQELLKLEKRGIKIRFLTDMRKENIESCKKFLNLKTLEMRHLDGIKGNFGIADRREFLEHIINREDEPLTHAIFSTAKGIVDARQYVFDNLWKKAIPAEDRFKEIEEGVEREFIQTLQDPSEIQNIGFDLVKSATSEILIVFSTANAFHRQIERAQGAKLLKQAAQERKVKIRILTPVDTMVEHSTWKLMEGLQTQRERQQQREIDIRYIEPHLQTKVTLLLIDKRYSLTVELRDDTKEVSYDAIGLATYSNSKSTVLSYVSIFESLWRQTELYEKLKIHDKMQRDFINIAAHELRTPIQPILGLSEILQSRVNDEDQLKLVYVISRNAKRLQSLTEDILDIARIESQTLKLNKESFNLKEIILNCINDLYLNRYINTENKDSVKIVYEPRDIIVRADKGRISQIISNILNNAIKFTTKGIISIASEKRDAYAEVIIKDTGVGIQPDFLPKLFSMFASRSFSGTGLGLFIAKSIIEVHGGQIRAQNNPDGIGATFSFSIPFSR